MKSLFLMSLLAASPAWAEPFDYETCITVLSSDLAARTGLLTALANQAMTMAQREGGVPDPLRVAMKANLVVRDQIDEAVKAYIATVADACEDLRKNH